MVMAVIFERFVTSAPACVMHRALMENIFAPAKLDALFQKTAKVQYERELLFSTLVDVIGQVVCRSSKSVHAAYVRERKRITATVQSLYEKLAHVEPETSRALVRHTAQHVRELVDRCKGTRKPLVKGFHVRILDGNHLGKTEHRLGVLRGTSAGALPGQTLVVLDPQRMLIEDIVCGEDGHAQERTLLDQLDIQPRDLIIDDRNFCTLKFLFWIKQRKAFFITREHGRMPWTPIGKCRYIGSCSTGRVYEQLVEIRHPETGKTTQLRRITIKLKTATRDGDMEIHLLTNLTVRQLSAVKVAELYRHRWTLEAAFNELTLHLKCELNTLGYPKAALFAFSVAVASYNLLAAVKGALRGIHGEETMQTKVSNFFLTNEINTNYGGMMIAMPPEEWVEFQTMSLAQLASRLHCWAKTADLESYPKHPRGPKKPKDKPANAKFQHVSTAKLLAEKKQAKGSKSKAQSP
jgi:IS4 transposase